MIIIDSGRVLYRIRSDNASMLMLRWQRRALNQLGDHASSICIICIHTGVVQKKMQSLMHPHFATVCIIKKLKKPQF